MRSRDQIILEALDQYKSESEAYLSRIDLGKFKEVTGLEITTNERGVVVSNEYLTLYADGVSTDRINESGDPSDPQFIDQVDFQVLELDVEDRYLADDPRYCGGVSELSCNSFEDQLVLKDEVAASKGGACMLYGLLESYEDIELPEGIDWDRVAELTGVEVRSSENMDEYLAKGLEIEVSEVVIRASNYRLVRETTNDKYYLVLTKPSFSSFIRLDGSFDGDTRYLASLELPEECLIMSEIPEDLFSEYTEDQFKALF